MKPYPEAEVEAAQVTAVSARGSYTSEIQCVCEDGWVSVYTDLGGFVAWCASLRTHTQTHRDGEMIQCKHTELAHEKETIFSCVCATWPCRLTRTHYRGKQQWNGWQWKADMTLRLLEPTWKHSTPGRGRGRRGRGWYRKSEQRELSTNWNGNWSSLHNLRLMRKQQQMKPPSFSPPFSFAGPGWFSLKRHLKQCFNLLPLWVVPFRSRYSGSLASISHNH